MDTALKASIPLVDFEAPAGTVVNHYLVVLSDGQSNVIDPSTSPLTAEFVVSVDGDYTVTASAIGTDGNPIGSPAVSNVVTVKKTPTTVTVQIPDAPTLAVDSGIPPAPAPEPAPAAP